jgi:hypothetical protein
VGKGLSIHSNQSFTQTSNLKTIKLNFAFFAVSIILCVFAVKKGSSLKKALVIPA